MSNSWPVRDAKQNFWHRLITPALFACSMRMSTKVGFTTQSQERVKSAIANVLDAQLPQESFGQQLFTAIRDWVYKVIFESAYQGLAWAG
jgi:hypothetical protein